MPDVAQLLKQDHRKVESLFRQYDSGDSSVVALICNELKVHTAIEEEVVYPVLLEVPDGHKLRAEAEREHQEVKEAVAQVERSTPDSDEVASTMQTIIEGVTHHVEEEESEVLPKMEQSLGHDRMTVLGEQLMAVKREQLVATGAIADLTKDELYELAQGAGIEGRSNMDKDELIEALSA